MDPRLRADQAAILWLPRHNPRLALLTSLPSGLCDGPTLAPGNPVAVRAAPEGDYLDLFALPPSRSALLLPSEARDVVAVVLPLDRLFEDRLDTARRLHRLLVNGHASPATLTVYRRRRLKLALRALDGALDGADYRAIAQALFGDRVPPGSAFRDDSLRAQAIRLSDTGSLSCAAAISTYSGPSATRRSGVRAVPDASPHARR